MSRAGLEYGCCGQVPLYEKHGAPEGALTRTCVVCRATACKNRVQRWYVMIRFYAIAIVVFVASLFCVPHSAVAKTEIESTVENFLLLDLDALIEELYEIKDEIIVIYIHSSSNDCNVMLVNDLIIVMLKTFGMIVDETRDFLISIKENKHNAKSLSMLVRYFSHYIDTIAKVSVIRLDENTASYAQVYMGFVDPIHDRFLRLNQNIKRYTNIMIKLQKEMY